MRPPLNSNDPPAFQKIADHVDHRVEVVEYGGLWFGTLNVAIECRSCDCVIVDEDRYPDGEIPPVLLEEA